MRGSVDNIESRSSGTTDGPVAEAENRPLPPAAQEILDGDTDLVVVAGGAARRLRGADKAMLRLPDGRTVLEAALATPVAGRRIVAGPRRSVGAVDVWAQETPPGGGPVAALAAALPWTAGPAVLVMAGDLPFAANAAAPLLAALPGHDVAVVTAAGRRQHLLAAWHRSSLLAAMERIGDPHGAAVRALFDGLDVVEVPDGAQWSRDLDTPSDVRRLLGTTARVDR